MIDLDDITGLGALDTQGMLAHVASFPRQCRDAWAMVRPWQAPKLYRSVDQIVIAGMGGSAIGGDLAAAVAADRSSRPILVHRDYDLPACADCRTLVIASSYSGNTEETISACYAAHERECPLIAITTGGQLARLAAQWQVPLFSFDYPAQPRAALGYLFVSLLGILQALALVEIEADWNEALAVLDRQAAELGPDMPRSQNPAKELASRLFGQVPVIIGTGPLAPVARRWKTQFNENSKAWAYFEVLPEMNHNALSGIHFPPGGADRFHLLFLSPEEIDPRYRRRMELSQQILEEQGIRCSQVPVRGRSPLAQVLSAVQWGDYVSCYLAFLYDADPTPIPEIARLKERMAHRIEQ
ncbi:MAG: bifunctional phosphoglucose/phosphomannose isomerase [Anaerolineae bacterium]